MSSDVGWPNVARIVLWDLDGTLLDPNGSIRGTINRVLEEAGFAAFDPGEVLVGMPLREILHLRTQDPARIEAMVERYREVFTTHSWRLVRFYPGMKELLGLLHERGVPQAIVTTKGEGEATQLLRDLDILHLFDTVVGDDDVRPLKPDPAPLVAACGRLGLRPRDAVMVGDTVYDVAAAKAAGAYAIGVLWGHGTRPGHEQEGADWIVEDAQALETALMARLAPNA